MRDILCNVPKFEVTLQFSLENTLNSQKRKILSSRTENTFSFQKLENAVQIGTITGHA